MPNTKNLFKKLLILFLVIAITAPTTTAMAAKVSLNKSSILIKKDKTFKLKLKGTKKAAKWSTSNKKIATVSDNGVVTANKAGNCKITAKVSGKKYTCKVTVTNPVIYAAKNSITIKDTGKLTFYFTVAGRFKWKIADPSIVTAKWSEKWTKGTKSSFTLYGHKNGTTTMTLTNNQNKDKAVITITVKGFDNAAVDNNNSQSSTNSSGTPTIKDASNTWTILNNLAVFNYDAASGYYSFTVEGLHKEEYDVYNVKITGYDAQGNQTFMTIEPAYYVNMLKSKFTYNQVPGNTSMIVISDFIS